MSGFKYLKPAKFGVAYLKAGVFGFAGSGKTFTACEIALGLAKKINVNQVAFFDTEIGSDDQIKKFNDAGIELLVYKGRAFKDLLGFLAEVENSGVKIAVLDSITHVWRELMKSYVEKLRRKNGLYFQDWAALKDEWQQFSDVYLNSKIHIIMCGRAGYEYDMEKNEETGRNELLKVGTRMKTESELGYEPSLLLEMVRLNKSEVSGKLDDKGWINRCIVLKDRSNTINGEEFDYPTYESFKPYIEHLNLGGEHIGVDVTRNSQDLFENPDYSYHERKKQAAILLEELQQELTLLGYAGTSADAQKRRTELLIKVFGTSSKTAIENMDLAKLKAGVSEIKEQREAVQVNQAAVKLAVNE